MKAYIFFISFFSFAIIYNLSEIRNDYKNAINSSEKSNIFHNKLKNIDTHESFVLQAYKGASLTLIARFEKEAKVKIKTFKQGTEWIDNAIVQDPNNLEIRLLRLSIQQNSPRILKYYTDIESDKSKLVEGFAKIKSSEVKEFIQNYVLESTDFTDAEKSVFTR